MTGLKVNFTKSQALNVLIPQPTVSLLKQLFKFDWNDSSIKYLGIALTARIENLYTNSYPPLYKKLENNLKTWSKHELSWLGRINSIKMTLLPRILYFFRSLPIPVNKLQLKKLHSKILKFTWGASSYQIPQHTLFLHKSKGGLGLPDLHKYYIAARLAQLSIIY